MKLKKFKFKTVNSTNDVAIRLIKKTNNKFGIIVADEQKKGRGQRGNKWISYKGNLFVSIFFSLDKINMSLKQLTKANCSKNCPCQVLYFDDQVRGKMLKISFNESFH